MNTLEKLTKLVGIKGIDTLKHKNKSWKLEEEAMLASALVISQSTKLKSLLENCTKYSGSPFELNAKIDIEKKDNVWDGKLITKTSTLDIKGMPSEALMSTVVALSNESQIVNNTNLIEQVKELTNNYKPKNVSLILKTNKFNCFLCKSAIELNEQNSKLCDCLNPLTSEDIIVKKTGERYKLDFSEKADKSQLKFFIKLINKNH